jgi:hypothetical protein
MRNPFGGGIADWTFLTDLDGTVHLGSAEVTFYNQLSGGTQYTDLSQDEAGTEPITSVTSSDGTDGLRLGTVPEFYGPDGVVEMYAQAGDLPRVKVQTTNAAAVAAAQAGDIDALQNRADNTDLLMSSVLFQVTGDDAGLLPAARPEELAGRRIAFINSSAPSADISAKNDVWIGRPL